MGLLLFIIPSYKVIHEKERKKNPLSLYVCVVVLIFFCCVVEVKVVTADCGSWSINMASPFEGWDDQQMLVLIYATYFLPF